MRRSAFQWHYPSTMVVVLFTFGIGCAGGHPAISSTALKPARPSESFLKSTASVRELGDAFTAVAEAVRPSVVFIRTELTAPRQPPSWNRQSSFAGALPPVPTLQRFASTSTGFIVTDDGYIVTNHHVVRGGRRVFVRLFDGRMFQAQVVGSDALSDIAVLKIDETNLPVAALGNSDSIRVGEWVLAIGNPLGNTLPFTVTAGIVSATARTLTTPTPSGRGTDQDFIQTDAAANSGNSGGPLVDLHGRIIGVNAAIATESGFYQGYTLAIPVNLMIPVVSQIIEWGHVKRSVIGASMVSATQEDAIAVGLDSISGVLVQDIGDAYSPARRAGLRPGDVIVDVDQHPVRSVAQLHREVWFKSPGDTVVLHVHREGASADLSVVLAPMQERSMSVRAGRGQPTNSEPSPPCSNNPLGVCFVEVNDALAWEIGINRKQVGLMVRGVYPVGPSYGKLVANRDIITHVNGERIHSAQDLDKALATALPGDIVSLHTYRFRSGENGFTRIRVR